MFNFWNIVVVEWDKVWVIVKSFDDNTYEVYVRIYRDIKLYENNSIKHFIYDKILSGEDLEYYKI